MTKRRVVRGVALAAAAGCAVPLAAGHPVWLLRAVPSFSPVLGLFALLAGTAGVFQVGALAVAAASFFSPRFFCRWLCPTGTCQSAAVAARRVVRWGSAGIPACTSPGQQECLPRFAVWILFVGVGAALAGYPLFAWLDPLALFNASAGLAHNHAAAADWVTGAGVLALMVLAVLAPGLWCGRVCPLGAFQDLLRLPLRLRREATFRAQAATLSRRAFLGLGMGAGWCVVDPGFMDVVPAVYPPGSVDPDLFRRLCSACGACVRACPAGILRHSTALAAMVDFSRGYCHEGCTRCGKACPTGAIARFTEETKYASRTGVARVNNARCNLADGRLCRVCVDTCPYDALDIEADVDGMPRQVIVDRERCTGCGYCEYVCPAAPVAIRIARRKRVI
ncbi:MAG: 4Fe-4S binding protein [Kiritimatiellaeota bacterium]|nr:4Fe-4S binding protein [Kiritimatiellota bacterium]